MIWNKFITGAPINSLAARVTGKGVHYEAKLRKEQNPAICQKEPLQTIRFNWEQSSKKGFVNLTGHSNGRLDVIGYYGKPNKNQKAKWVCKCKCGNYTLREAAAIKNWPSTEVKDCCRECWHLESLKKTTNNQ